MAESSRFCSKSSPARRPGSVSVAGMSVGPATARPWRRVPRSSIIARTPSPSASTAPLRSSSRACCNRSPAWRASRCWLIPTWAVSGMGGNMSGGVGRNGTGRRPAAAGWQLGRGSSAVVAERRRHTFSKSRDCVSPRNDLGSVSERRSRVQCCASALDAPLGLIDRGGADSGADRRAQSLCGLLRLLRGEPVLDTGRIGRATLLFCGRRKGKKLEPPR